MRFKQIKQQIQEDQDLFEINMSPNNLERLASQIDARAGMEFEMIVPGVTGDKSDEFEPEPDYDYDEGISDIESIMDFFVGDYNGRRQVQNVVNEMEADFDDWDREQQLIAWEEESEKYTSRYIWENYRDELESQAEETLKKEYGDNLDTTEARLMIRELAKELLAARVEKELEDQGSDYNDAQEEFFDDWNNDRADHVSEWLTREGFDSMSAVADQYDLAWPYWTEYEGSDEGDIESVADSFRRTIGRPVDYSSNYHGAQRRPGQYVVEPDGSLEPDDDSNELGLEFVSPPLPINEMLDDLDKVKIWAKQNGCYTNQSTGLHINVSISDSDDIARKMDQLDYVKLALLLGDEHVLEEFGRAGNTYCKSAMAEIRKRVAQRPEDAAMLLEKMKGGLEKLASKYIHTGTTSKYVSINNQIGYIEFRSPGGDWLNDNTFKAIKPTLLRFVVALDAAVDPEKYKQEYYKKLYKLLAPNSKDDTLAYFAKYAAGEMPKAALKSFVRQAQLERSITKGKQTGKMWWNVSRPGYFASIEVVASSKEEAIDIAIQPGNYPDWARARNTLQATPLRSYKEPAPQTPATDNTGNLQNYEIYRRGTNDPVLVFSEIDDEGALIRLDDYRRRNPGGDFAVRRSAPLISPQAPRTLTTPGLPQQQFTGRWIIRIGGQEVHRVGGLGNDQGDANRWARAWILRQDANFLRQHQGQEVEVVPEMS